MGWWFGRILTFEILADPDAISVGAILTDATQGIISTDYDRSMIGYAAYGNSVRAAVEPLVNGFAIDLFDDGSQVRGPVNPEALALRDDELGNSASQEPAPRIEREQSSNSSLPAVIRVSYYDPARDYQSGEVRASAGDQTGSEERVELPAVLEAGDAKSLVHEMIAHRWARRDSVTLRLPPAFLDLEPGEVVELPLAPRKLTVERCTVDSFVVIAECAAR